MERRGLDPSDAVALRRVTGHGEKRSISSERDEQIDRVSELRLWNPAVALAELQFVRGPLVEQDGEVAGSQLFRHTARVGKRLWGGRFRRNSDRADQGGSSLRCDGDRVSQGLAIHESPAPSREKAKRRSTRGAAGDQLASLSQTVLPSVPRARVFDIAVRPCFRVSALMSAVYPRYHLRPTD